MQAVYDLSTRNELAEFIRAQSEIYSTNKLFKHVLRLKPTLVWNDNNASECLRYESNSDWVYFEILESTWFTFFAVALNTAILMMLTLARFYTSSITTLKEFLWMLRTKSIQSKVTFLIKDWWNDSVPMCFNFYKSKFSATI